MKEEQTLKTVRCDLEKSCQDFPHFDVQSGLNQHSQPLLFPLKKKIKEKNVNEILKDCDYLLGIFLSLKQFGNYLNQSEN
jgi:hypothetical protein